MADLSDSDSGEVLQQIHLLLLCVWMQIHSGCLRELQRFWEVPWNAFYIEEPCAEVQRIFAFQELVGYTTAVYSFNATPLAQSNPLNDLVDVEENGLCWDLLPVVVQGVVKDLQYLQSPMHDAIVCKTTFDTRNANHKMYKACALNEN